MLNSKWRSAALGGWTVAAGAVLLGAPAAQAVITVDSRSSIVDVFAAAGSSFGGDPVTDADGRSGSGTGSFNQRVDAMADAFGTSAESEAGQNSSLTFTAGNLSGVSANGDSSVAVLASSDEDLADADGTSEFGLLFTVPAGELYDYTLGGELTTNSFHATGQVYLYDVARDTDLLFRSGNAGTFGSTGQLQPGQYQLYASTFAIASAASPGSGSSAFTLSLGLTPAAIPEPATIGLMSLLAVPLVRPRRRRTGPLS